MISYIKKHSMFSSDDTVHKLSKEYKNMNKLKRMLKALFVVLFCLGFLPSSHDVRAADGGTWSLNFDAPSPTLYVNALINYHGKLYTGTNPTGEIYVYDGATWAPAFNTDFSIAPNLAYATVWSLAEYNNKLYAGTDYYSYETGGGSRVWEYDGTNWSVSDTAADTAKAFAVYNGKLYAGTEGGLIDGRIKVFDGTSWSESFSSDQSAVFSLAVYGDKLYAGTYNNDTHQGFIYAYDGTSWSLAYDTNQVSVDSLAVYNNKLYAGTVTNGVILVFDGTTWSQSYDSPDYGIASLAVFGDKLYAGGKYSGNIYVYDGSAWTLSYSTSQDFVSTLASYNNRLYAGTAFAAKVFEFTPIPTRQLTAIAPTQIWVGLKNSDDVGTKFDLKAEVYATTNATTSLISTGEVNGVSGGSSGFNNAKLDIIPLSLPSSVDFPQNSTLSIKLYVRNTCSGHTHNAGTARLWYNDSAANSKFGLTIDTATSDYYLRDGSALSTAPGSGPKKTIDVAAGSPCSVYKLFGTWSITL